MLKTQACIEIKKGERIHRFYCDNDSPLGEAYDALREMMSYVVTRIQEAEKQKEQSKEESNNADKQ